MKKLTMASLALCVVALTSGCSSNDEDELVLPEINNQFEAEVVWQESVGDGVEHYFSRLSPVSYQNTIFSASRDGVVIAFDTETGEQKWRVDVRKNSSFWPWKTTTVRNCRAVLPKRLVSFILVLSTVKS